MRHEFSPGEEPTVYTADICAEVGHEHCEGFDRTSRAMKANWSSAFAAAIAWIEGDLN